MGALHRILQAPGACAVRAASQTGSRHGRLLVGSNGRRGRPRPFSPRTTLLTRPRPHVPRARPCGRARLCLNRAWPLRQARPGPWCGAPGADSASGSRPETRENTGRDRWRQGKEGARDPAGVRGTICRAQDPFFRARARPYLPRSRPCGRARQSALSSPASSRTAAACPTESHLSHLIPLNPA